MVELVHLQPREQMPNLPEDEPWLLVEASDDGRFFGTGWGRRRVSCEVVLYASLAENDISLDRAISAAKEWAVKRGISRIWVQANPA